MKLTTNKMIAMLLGAATIVGVAQAKYPEEIRLSNRLDNSSYNVRFSETGAVYHVPANSSRKFVIPTRAEEQSGVVLIELSGDNGRWNALPIESADGMMPEQIILKRTQGYNDHHGKKIVLKYQEAADRQAWEFDPAKGVWVKQPRMRRYYKKDSDKDHRHHPHRHVVEPVMTAAPAA